MLEGIDAVPSDRFADWFAIERRDGRDTDVGMHRHWIDPTLPFTAAVGSHAHGLLVTSATLRDATGDPERSEEHTSELQSLMRISYAVFCLKKKKTSHTNETTHVRVKNT